MAKINGMTIVEAIWVSLEKKDQVAILLEREDGSRTSIKADAVDSDENWLILNSVFNKDDITNFSEKRRADQKRDQRNRERKNDDQQKTNALLKNLFEAKLEAFEIEAVQKSENRELRSKIRRSKSLTEVYAYTAALILSEMDNATE